jgi:hypothetical protein
MMVRTCLSACLLLLPLPLLALSDSPSMPEWLTGAWEYQNGEAWADEYWTPLRGDLMLGSSRSGQEDRTIF